jgi:predicted CopG family antitoxin
MTNITLSIDDEVYKKMKNFSDIRWSEFVRKCIQKRVEELQKIEIDDWDTLEFLGDEKLLAESWLSKEDEKAFEYLQ